MWRKPGIPIVYLDATELPQDIARCLPFSLITSCTSSVFARGTAHPEGEGSAWGSLGIVWLGSLGIAWARLGSLGIALDRLGAACGVSHDTIQCRGRHVP
jgi:hypothetical protein